eukprot:3779342-Prymnesium_polylepis.1
MSDYLDQHADDSNGRVLTPTLVVFESFVGFALRPCMNIINHDAPLAPEQFEPIYQVCPHPHLRSRSTPTRLRPCLRLRLCPPAKPVYSAF